MDTPCVPTLKLKNIYITKCIYIYIYIKYGFYGVPTLNFVRKTKKLDIINISKLLNNKNLNNKKKKKIPKSAHPRLNS